MTEKISANWLQWVGPILVSVGVYIGLSQGHIDEAQAIKISRGEIEDRSFPLTDGELLKRDIKHIAEIVKENKIYLLYLTDIIDKEKLKEELSRLPVDKEKNINITMINCDTRYPKHPDNHATCYDMLFSCHYKNYLVE